MKKFALAFLFCSASAFATMVSYTTTVSFGADPLSSTDSVSNGGITIQANGVTNSVNPIVPTTSNLVLFQVQNTPGPGPGTFSTAFTLHLTQTPPGAPGQTFGGATLSGTVSDTTGGLIVTFTSPTILTFTSGPTNTTYSIIFDDTALNVFNLPVAGESRDLTAEVTQVLPEPASLGLMGASLLGLGLFVRRRTKK